MMLSIPREDLIKLLQLTTNETLRQDQMNFYFKEYGDTWYIEDGAWKCFEVNEKRQALLKGE